MSIGEYGENPESTAEYNFCVVQLNETDDVEDVRMRFERMGADLYEKRQPSNAKYPHLIFKFPKKAHGVLSS
jgi:hypothetical protein